VEKKPAEATAESTAAPEGPVLLGQFRNERCCIRCEEAGSPELGSVLRCRGCQNSFHLACLEQALLTIHHSHYLKLFFMLKMIKSPT
jgi:hypothetical protein